MAIGRLLQRLGARRIAAVTALLVVFALAIAAGVSAAGSSAGASAVHDAARFDKAAVLVQIEAKGWGAESSSFVVRFVGSDEKTDGVDFYHVVSAGEPESAVVTLPVGSYELSYISAVNSDGSIYRTPEQPVEVVVSGKEETGDSKGSFEVDAAFDQVPADDVTQDDIDEILGDLADVVQNGDETLTGDAGKDVVDTAAENAANAPNVDKDEVEAAGEEASEAVSEEPSQHTKPNESPSSKPSGSSSSTGNGGSSGSSTSSGKPAHEHSWVAQTERQWVQDSAAWDEPVYETQKVYTYHAECRAYNSDGGVIGCGASATLSSGAEAENWCFEHLRSHSSDSTGHFTHWWSTTEYNQVQTGSIHHDATGHYETVTTGYTCSGCGATKQA